MVTSEKISKDDILEVREWDGTFEGAVSISEWINDLGCVFMVKREPTPTIFIDYVEVEDVDVFVLAATDLVTLNRMEYEMVMSGKSIFKEGSNG